MWVKRSWERSCWSTSAVLCALMLAIFSLSQHTVVASTQNLTQRRVWRAASEINTYTLEDDEQWFMGNEASVDAVAGSQPVSSNRTAFVSRLVSNGEQVEEKDFPSAVFISMRDAKTYDYYRCSGVLIEKRVVLTAAHCVLNTNGSLVHPSQLRLKIGVTDIGKRTKIYRVMRIVTPRYRPYDSFGDIAILQLPVEAESPAEPSKLAKSKKNPKSKTILTVFGWGDTEDEEWPDLLSYVDMKVPSKSRCKTLRKRYGLARYQMKDHFCIGTGNEGKATCAGDSGSPFLSEKGEVVGLTSYGPMVDCGSKSNFDVATSIAYWRKWINKRMKKYNMKD